MKNYNIAIPKLALYSILYPLSFVLLCAILFIPVYIANDGSNGIYPITHLLFSVILALLFPIYYGKSFCFYKITEYGIHNRYISVKWEDINTCDIYPVCVNIRSRIHKDEIAAVVAFPAQSVKSYKDLDPQKCIFFSVSKRNLDLIDKYCKDKCNDVQYLLLRYSDVMR